MRYLSDIQFCLYWRQRPICTYRYRSDHGIISHNCLLFAHHFYINRFFTMFCGRALLPEKMLLHILLMHLQVLREPQRTTKSKNHKTATHRMPSNNNLNQQFIFLKGHLRNWDCCEELHCRNWDYCGGLHNWNWDCCGGLHLRTWETGTVMESCTGEPGNTVYSSGF